MRDWIKQRAGEPSTWAGVAAIATAAAQWLGGDKSAALSGLAGLIAVGMREKAA